MHIGIEAERANAPQKTGVEHYAKQLILHLAKVDQKNTYTLYLRTQPEAWFLHLPKNFSVKVMPFPVFWTQLRLSLEMVLNPVDLLFVPASALPLIHPKKSVVTIHDVMWKRFPDAETRFNLWFLDWSTKAAVKNASRVIAVSKSTAADLGTFYGVSEQKVSVVYHGFDATPAPSEAPSDLSLPSKYLFFMSTLQPRKNLTRLIDAFEMLKLRHPELPHKLVVAGKPGWKYEPILERIEQAKESVVYLGHVSDAARLYTMAHADGFVQPSLYEGFGMGVLEAFAAGIPTTVSSAPSLPEVAGTAAITFDPESSEAIAAALLSVLTDEQARTKLRAAGTERLAHFSWERCARETLAVFESA